MPLTLVVGGTRSGKSEVAEALASAAAAPVTYVATGAAADSEMVQRIAAHRERRPADWRTLETTDPLAVLSEAPADTVLLDSLGSWIAGLMGAASLFTDAALAPLDPREARARAGILQRVRELAAAAAERPALTVIVAEESGLGVVAADASTRRYLDLAGEAAQIASAAATEALLVVAGRTLPLGRGLSLGREPPLDRGPHLDPASSFDCTPHLDTPSPFDRAPHLDRAARDDHEVELAELRDHGDSMIPPDAEDFAVNVEQYARPAWLEQALAEALAGSAAYPDEREAVEAVARRHGRGTDEVVLLNGGNEAFPLIAAALRPRRAVCVHPSFTEPEAALRAQGHRVERAFRRAHDFALDPAAVRGDADLVVTTNPNNPSGVLDRAGTLAALTRPGRTLVVDEAFMDFVPGEPESLAGRADLPGLVVVRSLTKLWSLAGVRAGYLLAPAQLADLLRRVRPSWNVNALALAAIRACSIRPGAANAVIERVAHAREALRAELGRLSGVETWPSAANFLLARVAKGEQVHERLLERGIAVRPARTFPGLTPDHLRLTVRDPAANARLVSALEEASA